MDQAAILSGLTDLFREIFDDDALVLTPETEAADVPGWDSMNHITIVVETEQRFGVKFQTSEIEELKNVGEFVRVIERKLG
ncbi:MAG: acyl carrier protein [Acetobacteraceae bacterium]|jgi:acyl carrier protein